MEIAIAFIKKINILKQKNILQINKAGFCDVNAFKLVYLDEI